MNDTERAALVVLGQHLRMAHDSVEWIFVFR